MKKIRIVTVSNKNGENQRVLKEFARILGRENNIEIACIHYLPEKRMDLIGEIRALQPELLISADLSGFEQCTLTDNIAYNLLGCRQLHLLLHEKLPGEQYLNKQMSIAMFFYCVGNAYCEYLRKLYPNLPYLKEIPGWHLGTDEKAAVENAEILRVVFREMLRECRMSSILKC